MPKPAKAQLDYLAQIVLTCWTSGTAESWACPGLAWISTHRNSPNPAVGGAMDLAIGARRTWVMMEHSTKSGEPKLVERCRYPLTGLGCVSRVYTDLAVIELRLDGAHVLDIVDGMSLAELQARTGVRLLRA